mmetsp:Transcript_8504/g.35543  ORF Transcript_8504/g.35543 Transcript_8504/m.35543 type:complete len:241 (-) Transcript_8504:390-1112(-)
MEPPPSETSEPAPFPESLGTSFSESPSARAARESGEPGAGSGSRARICEWAPGRPAPFVLAEPFSRFRARAPKTSSPERSRLPPAAAPSKLDARLASRYTPWPPWLGTDRPASRGDETRVESSACLLFHRKPPRRSPAPSPPSSETSRSVSVSGSVPSSLSRLANAPTPFAQGFAEAVNVSPHISAMRSSKNAAAPSTPEAKMERCRRAAASVAGLSDTKNTTRHSAACFAAMRTASRTA